MGISRLTGDFGYHFIAPVNGIETGFHPLLQHKTEYVVPKSCLNPSSLTGRHLLTQEIKSRRQSISLSGMQAQIYLLTPVQPDGSRSYTHIVRQ